MKQRLILAVAVIVTALMGLVYEFFSNETFQYFSTEPHRVLYVIALAVAGGLAALCFARLPPQTRWKIRVFAWGTSASASTVLLGYFGFLLSSVFSTVDRAMGLPAALLTLLVFTSIAAYAWFEFYRAWK